MNNLEHAKILIERPSGKPTIGRRRRRRSHSRSRLCLVWWKKSKNCAAPWPDWWGLRTTTNSAQWRPLFVWQQCPMRIRCPC